MQKRRKDLPPALRQHRSGPVQASIDSTDPALSRRQLTESPAAIKLTEVCAAADQTSPEERFLHIFCSA